MTKEQLQTELEAAQQENARLKAMITEIETAAAENKIFPSPANENPDLQILSENYKKTFQIQKETIQLALEIIRESCEDHCPHHKNPDACRNCSIHAKTNQIIRQSDLGPIGEKGPSGDQQ